MKKKLRSIGIVCVILLSFAGCTVSNIPIEDGPVIGVPVETPLETPQPTHTPEEPGLPYAPIAVASGEFRALWVATVLNLDFPTKPGLPAAALRYEIDAIVSNTRSMGLNAIILQVRPTGDALYESEIFPWSEWLSGEQGKGVDGFDPLAYWIAACREAGIELHAWLNPYRIIHPSTNSSDPQTLSPDNPVRINPALAVGYTSSNGRSGLFLDPGLPEARKLILDGISELIAKYDVDGIHIDDYFYPGVDFNDAASFSMYGGGLALEDWRRENVNTLVSDIQSVIRVHNSANGKSIRWGISPTAIWKNGSNDPLGIPTTSGQESYHALYADTRRWVTEGWVDYICPQIYWYIGFEIADFEAIFNWWSELCEQHNVDLYIGHAAYREFEDNQPPNWQGEMVRQLEMVAGSDTAKGSVFYRYFSLRSPVGQAVQDFYAAKDGVPIHEPIMTLDALSIGFPAGDDTITGTPATALGYNIVGTSIPDKPLYLNGAQVTSRTVEGFFHVFAPLEQGDNVFTFSQPGEEDVTRVITLKEPVSVTSTPEPTPTVTNVTTLDYAIVVTDDAWVYATNSTSDGLGYMLSRGQMDRIVATSDNNLVKLSCGVWVRSDAITITREDSVIDNVLSEGWYDYYDWYDYEVVRWNSHLFPAAIVSFDGKTLTLNLGMHTEAPKLNLPDDLSETLLEGMSSGVRDDIPYYKFTLRDDAQLEGYFVDFDEAIFSLGLKKRKTLAEGDMPLANIRIMLDAGHGGEFPGAVGPLGHDMPEKELTMINTQKLAHRLRELGANVLLTREDDADVSLQDRVNMSRQVIPDLFISLHINSVAETANASSARGFTVWYNTPNSVAFSETTLDVMGFINPGTNRQRTINHANFFVCRPWWSPHVLFEASFIMNIDDFVWLLDPAQQDRMADAAVEAVLEYFSEP